MYFLIIHSQIKNINRIKSILKSIFGIVCDATKNYRSAGRNHHNPFGFSNYQFKPNSNTVQTPALLNYIF